MNVLCRLIKGLCGFTRLVSDPDSQSSLSCRLNLSLRCLPKTDFLLKLFSYFQKYPLPTLCLISIGVKFREAGPINCTFLEVGTWEMVHASLRILYPIPNVSSHYFRLPVAGWYSSSRTLRPFICLKPAYPFFYLTIGTAPNLLLSLQPVNHRSHYIAFSTKVITANDSLIPNKKHHVPLMNGCSVYHRKLCESN